MEQRRVLVVFSADEAEATVTCEIWRGKERIACYVGAPLDLDVPLVQLALDLSHMVHPTLFD